MNEEERQRFVELERIVASLRGPLFDPNFSQALDQKIALPYLSSGAPTESPLLNGKEYVYKNGSNYYIAVYVDGAWRSVLLDTSTFSLNSHSFTIGLTGSTSSEQTVNEDCGFVPKLVIGDMFSGSANLGTGFWSDNDASNFPNISGNRADGTGSFLEVEANLYVHVISVSSNTLNLKWKNSGVSDRTAKIRVFG